MCFYRIIFMIFMMKARIKGTNTIVECIESDHLNYVGFGIKCKHSNGRYEIISGDCLIELENDFDWQSFRAAAAKDILCAIIQSGYYGEDRITHQSELAVGYANELCKQIKEKEEK